MPADLRVETRSLADGRTSAVFTGEVDVTSVPDFRTGLEQAIAQGAGVAVLTGLTYLDSAGIEALFNVARRAELEIVAGPDSVVRGLIELVGLGEVATLRDGV